MGPSSWLEPGRAVAHWIRLGLARGPAGFCPSTTCRSLTYSPLTVPLQEVKRPSETFDTFPFLFKVTMHFSRSRYLALSVKSVKLEFFKVCMVDLLFDWFGFNQTSKCIANFSVTKPDSIKQEVSCTVLHFHLWSIICSVYY